MPQENSESAQIKSPHVNLFGILIERKTDILAFSAFLLSIAGVLTQIYFFLRGPDIEAFPPDQVLLMSYTYPNGKAYLRIAARMAFFNRGETGNDVVMREIVSFKLGKLVYEQHWQDYTESSAEGTKLDMKRKGDALPVSISAGSAASHETWFAPRTVREQGIPRGVNFIEWDSFLAKISQQSELVIDFRFKTYGGKSGAVQCRVSLDDNLRRHLGTKGWSAPSCEPGAG